VKLVSVSVLVVVCPDVVVVAHCGRWSTNWASAEGQVAVKLLDSCSSKASGQVGVPITSSLLSKIIGFCELVMMPDGVALINSATANSAESFMLAAG
jgi:hypothetical protein